MNTSLFIPRLLSFYLLIIFLSGCSGPEAELEKKYLKAQEFEKINNFEEAVKLYSKTAELGHVGSQFSLAVLYHNGLGVPQDLKKAANLYLKAANRGNAQSQYNVARMFDKGEGVPKNYIQSAYWYAKAAAQGRPDAQVDLGFMYFYGEGVPLDKITAYAWMTIAAESGYVRAKQNRKLISKSMKSSEIKKGEKVALRIKKGITAK